MVDAILTEAEEEILTSELSSGPFLIDGASHTIPCHVTSTSVQSHRALLPAFPHCPGEAVTDAPCALPRPLLSPEFKSAWPAMAHTYTSVASSGLPNYRGCIIPLKHGLNIAEWRAREHLLPDRSLVDMLDFGFPIGYTGEHFPTVGLDNHSSAVAHPSHEAQTGFLGHEGHSGPILSSW